MTPKAIQLLQEATEPMISELFKHTNLITINRKAETICTKDLHLAAKLTKKNFVQFTKIRPKNIMESYNNDDDDDDDDDSEEEESNSSDENDDCQSYQELKLLKQKYRIQNRELTAYKSKYEKLLTKYEHLMSPKYQQSVPK